MLYFKTKKIMKKSLIVFAAAAAVFAQSCNKDMCSVSGRQAPAGGDREICFCAPDPDVEVGTKVEEVTAQNLASFNLLANVGGISSQTQQWTVTATRDGSSDTYLTGKYWPYANPSYHFYASNVTMTSVANGATVTVDGNTDVICAYNDSPTFGSVNQLNFTHIFSRIGGVSVVSSKDYGITDLSVVIKSCKTGGTYDIRTLTWSNPTVTDKALTVGDNDLYVVPGAYTLSVTYTFTKGDYVGTFTKTANIELTVGKAHTIDITLAADPAVPLTVTVKVSAWTSKTIPITLN